MTITTSPGCSWSPSTQSQSGSFSCMISASINSSGCTATLTNESFQTNCNDSNECYFTEINNINQTLTCDGAPWTTTTTHDNQSVTTFGSCTCQVLGAAANPSTSTTGSSTQATPSSGSSTPTSVSSTLVRTSTALLMVYVVAFSIVGSI